MKRWLMDILACPVKDCRSSLELDVFDAHMLDGDNEKNEEIDAGLITCPKCNRWYPVIDGISCLLPDDLRMKGKQHIEETKFLKRWKAHIDSKILQNGIPFGLE